MPSNGSNSIMTVAWQTTDQCLEAAATRGSVRGVNSPGSVPGCLPRPLELLDREREGGRRLRDPPELDHEVRGRGRVGGLEDHDRVGLPEEAQELVEHHVVRELRVLEEAGGLLELSGEDLELGHEEHGVTPRKAPGGRYLTVSQRLSRPDVRGRDPVHAHVDEGGLRDGRPKDLVGPSLAGIPFDEEARDRVEEGERIPEKLREVPDGRLRERHGPAEGPDLEAHDDLAQGPAEEGLPDGRVRIERDPPEDPEHLGPPLPLEKEDREDGGEHGDTIKDERDDALHPVDLEGPVVAEEVEPAHHECIPRLHGTSRYLKDARGPTGLTKGPLRSPIIHHESGSVASSRWHAEKGVRNA